MEPNRLHDALDAIQEYFDQLGDLRNLVVGGLFEAAMNQEFDDVPCALIERLLSNHDTGRVYYEKPLRELLKRESIIRNLIVHVINLLKDHDNKVYYHEIASFTGSCCEDSIFSAIPRSASELNRRQEWFLARVLGSYFNRQPNKERLAYFQQRAPAFTQNLQVPEKQEKAQRRDLLEERRIISDAMKDRADPINQTWRLLYSFARIEHGDRAREVKLHDAQAVLARLPLQLKTNVLNVFRKCIESIHYKKERGEEHQVSMTRHEFEIPFWIIRAEGARFEPRKLEEIVTCYGFSGSSEEEEAPYKALLEEIRQEDKEFWKQCVIEILEDSFLHSPCLVVRYLVELKNPLYLERCSERLSGGLFSRADFSDLLFYYRSFHDGDYSGKLRACYEQLRRPFPDPRREITSDPVAELGTNGAGRETTVSAESHAETKDKSGSNMDQFDDLAQFRPLLMLLAEDDDWAWQEFGSRLQLEDVPIDPNLSDIHPKRFPLNPERLRVLADWYAFIRRRLQDEYGGFHNTAKVLLETIVNIGGEAAITELKRLQNQRAFPNPEWLSHAILRIDDQMLSDAKSSLDVGDLLDFINKPTLGAISSNRDLFEWVCESIEEIKESLELRAEWVAGFWNGNAPKQEPECQNVLWPTVKQKLLNLGISHIEEKYIGSNKCDFWVVLPGKETFPFQVAVELKVARVGYDRSELVDPIEEQLWKKYLYPEKCHYGIYIVLWFKDNERYKGPERFQSIEELLKEVEDRCKTVASAQRVSITPYVIDLTTAYRKH
jgi:hypothetical protein